MLKKLYVDNFRSFVDFSCEFGPRQLLMGGNGAGKTTIFDVLEVVRDLCVRGEPFIQPGGKPGEPEHWRVCGRTATRWLALPEQTFELTVEGPAGEYRFRLITDDWGKPPRPRILLEELTLEGQALFRFENGEAHLFDDNNENRVKYPFDWHKSAFATVAEQHDNQKLWWFKEWLDSLLIISPDPVRMSGIAGQEAKNPDRSLSNFADWFKHLKLTEHLVEFDQALQDVIEGFITLRLEEAGERRHELKVRISSPRQNSHGPYQEYLLDELSDGQRSLIGLYAVRHFRAKKGSTLCFDEPDNFLSLREVVPWLQTILESTEETNAQVLIASHHPEMLNRMAFKEGLLFYRGEEQQTLVRPFSDPSDTGLKAAELIARGWET